MSKDLWGESRGRQGRHFAFRCGYLTRIRLLIHNSRARLGVVYGASLQHRAKLANSCCWPSGLSCWPDASTCTAPQYLSLFRSLCFSFSDFCASPRYPTKLSFFLCCQLQWVSINVNSHCTQSATATTATTTITTTTILLAGRGAAVANQVLHLAPASPSKNKCCTTSTAEIPYKNQLTYKKYYLCISI